MDASLTTILEVALQQGIWAALYIYLFFRMLKENAQREEKYQGMIENLSGNILKGIDDIQSRLDDMSQDVKKQDKECSVFFMPYHTFEKGNERYP